MTDLDKLDAAYALTNATVWREDGYRVYCKQDGEEIVVFETKHFDARGLNVEGIVALHNAWPEVSKELRETREKIVELEKLLDAYKDAVS